MASNPPFERDPSHSYYILVERSSLSHMSRQKQTSSGGTTFASYEVKEEGNYPLRSYQHELEAHMVAPGTVIAEGTHPPPNLILT